MHKQRNLPIPSHISHIYYLFIVRKDKLHLLCQKWLQFSAAKDEIKVNRRQAVCEGVNAMELFKEVFFFYESS
jgi:hypothetical protein